MATLYLRGSRWWISYGSGRDRVQLPTGLVIEERQKAEALKRELERKLEALKSTDLPGVPARTFKGYRAQWIERRKLNGAPSWKDDAARLQHARVLDPMRLDEIRPRHLRDLVESLNRGRLAPRTRIHVVSVLRLLFRDAVVDELITASPVVFGKGVMPKKKDKDPRWRPTAVYSHDEVATLISSPAIPEDRRTLYALLFLTGMRIGEASDRRWKDIEKRSPLDCLSVYSSWNTKLKLSKGTKTDKERQVPIHRALAESLDAWRNGGWERIYARKPEPKDLIVPRRSGGNLTTSMVLKALKKDLVAGALRTRRAHDARRTFVSLGLADGARRDVLEWVSHGPRGDVFSLYTTLPWATLCEAVSALNIKAVSGATMLLLDHTNPHDKN